MCSCQYTKFGINHDGKEAKKKSSQTNPSINFSVGSVVGISMNVQQFVERAKEKSKTTSMTIKEKKFILFVFFQLLDSSISRPLFSIPTFPITTNTHWISIIRQNRLFFRKSHVNFDRLVFYSNCLNLHNKKTKTRTFILSPVC